MASDASVRNVDDLRQFGQNLRHSSENLVKLFQQLSRQMKQVSEGWNDTKNQAFMADFERKTVEINKLSQEMQVYAQFITKTCDLLDQYKSIR